MLELLFVVTVASIVAAAAAPRFLSGLDRARAVAAARYLGQQCAIARLEAVGRGRYVAVRFTPAGDDFAARMYADGNRNGVRVADIADGIDLPLNQPMRLSDRFAGARIALDPALGLGDDPVKLGGTTLLSFAPAGTATAGSVYVRGADGTQLTVRVLGATGRTRVLAYRKTTNSWEQP